MLLVTLTPTPAVNIAALVHASINNMLDMNPLMFVNMKVTHAMDSLFQCGATMLSALHTEPQLIIFLHILLLHNAFLLYTPEFYYTVHAQEYGSPMFVELPRGTQRPSLTMYYSFILFFSRQISTNINSLTNVEKFVMKTYHSGACDHFFPLFVHKGETLVRVSWTISPKITSII